MNTPNRIGRRTSCVGWLFLASTLVVLMFLPTSDAGAQQLACSAALDVDVHYCLDEGPGFPPTCNPIDIKDGDTVTLTVEVTNDSQHNAGPPPADPPAGRLQVGQQFKVFYACSASTCTAAERLPGWFSFVAVDYVEPGLSFSDDGNGYSGTLSVTAPVVYAEGDGTPRHVLRIRTLAHMPPAVPNSIVFARSEGSPAMLLVTDSHCLPGLTGTGEGSTAGKFGGEKSVCGNNGRIILASKTAKTDQGSITASLRGPLASIDPPTQDVTFTVSNANGICFTQTVPAGSSGWTVRPGTISYDNPDGDVSARGTTPGIASITFRERASQGGQIQIKVSAVGDTEGCNLADMTTTVTVGSFAFSHGGTWKTTPTGWRFP